MKLSDIIYKPITTEKSIQTAKTGQYIFLVNPKANKTEIKKALTKLYKIEIEKINTSLQQPKSRLIRGRHLTQKRLLVKKAIITTKGKKKLDVTKFDSKKQ